MSTIREVMNAVLYVADSQFGLITAQQLAEIGFNHSRTAHRIRTGGPWQRVLPGTYALTNGGLTVEQQEAAGVLFAGPGAVLTGVSALRRHGVRYLPDVNQAPAVHVLIPQRRQRKSAGFVTVERTERLPEMVDIGGLPCAPVARSAIDAARRVTHRQATRALLLEIVQRNLATIDDLNYEKRQGQRRGTALITETLEEGRSGVRSAPEAELRELFADSRLPSPLWNPKLYLLDDTFLAQPDGLIVESVTAVEVDSREHHSPGEGWATTLKRDADMTAAGILVVHLTPHQVRTERGWCLARISKVHELGLQRPKPQLRIVSSEG